MDLETAQTTTTAKLPILKQGEYDMWRLRIEQYFQVQDYALWDVIENGNSFKPAAQTTTNADGTSTSLIPGPVTTEEKVQKKNDVKARSMLLMALPNEHLMTFNQYKDAKTLFAAIQTRFGGNEATKKTQKTLLKQMYENFSAPSTESLDSIFNRLQKIVSQLAILGENISQEDLNLKFLRSLPSEWNTHVVVWRNKPDLDTMSFDDLYNNFKIVEQEVKGTASSSSSSSSQNMAFVSSPSSTNEVNTAYGVSTANTQVSPASTQVSTASTQVSTANLSDDTVYAFLASQPNGSQLVYEDLEQIHEDDIEEMDLKWQLALLSMRTRSAEDLGNQESRDWNKDNSISTRRNWLFLPPNPDLSNSGLEEFQQSEFEAYGPKTSKNFSEDTSNEVGESHDALLVEELVLDDKLMLFKASACLGCRPTKRNSASITFKRHNYGHPQKEDQGYVDSDLKAHEQKHILSSDYKEFDGDILPLGRSLKEEELRVKGHSKTPYELFRGRTPSLSFMKPFGCHVTILNTLDYLGMFDGKSDEGFFVGYSINSKAFRVYNIRTRKVEENLHIRFLEDKPIIAGDGPKWLFDIECVLTKSMNYVPVVAGTNSNDFVRIEESIGAGHSNKETGSSQDYILMPLWKDGSLFDSSSKNASKITITSSDPAKKKDAEVTNINTGSLNINTVSPTVTTTPLEATHADFFGDETKLDMSNITTTYFSFFLFQIQ
ncbi:ribonuclease H-like domain-containing protein [Tanacetum coccineum]